MPIRISSQHNQDCEHSDKFFTISNKLGLTLSEIHGGFSDIEK